MLPVWPESAGSIIGGRDTASLYPELGLDQCIDSNSGYVTMPSNKARAMRLLRWIFP